MDARRRRGRWLQGGATRERFRSRRTYDADAYGKTVWFWHPWLLSSCRWQNRSNRNAGVFRLYLYARVRISMHTLHTRPRVQRAPGIPCTLRFWGGDKFMQASGAMRRENAKSYLRRMGRAQRNPSLTRDLDGYRCAPPILRTSRPCERSEAIHSAACGAVDCFALLAMARIGRGVPDTPACVGYRAPFGPPKILQPAARSRFRSRPCERPFFRSKLTMTDQSVIL